MKDLGTLGGTLSGAIDINNAGDVVGGSSLTGATGNHAFLYHAGVMTDLGMPFGTFSTASAINSSGQVIVNASGGGENHPFLSTNGALARIDPSGFSPSVLAHGINDQGQVVGIAATATSGGAFLYSPGGQFSLLDLSSVFAVSAEAQDINNRGQIVGQFGRLIEQTGAVESDGFLYNNGTVENLGPNVLPRAINDAGDIVGGGVGSFLYRNGKLTIVDASGAADDINNRGDIVGHDNFGVYLYSGGVLKDLNTLIDPNSGLKLLSAVAINDLGQIVGGAMTATGETHAYLLNPVPEPTALSSVLLGATLLLRRRRIA